MGKKSNKKYDINSRSDNFKSRGRIEPGVDNQKSITDIEATKYTIGYQYYRHDLCEVEDLKQAYLKKTINHFKQFCRCANVSELADMGVSLTKVNNNSTYMQYFKGLDPDVEVQEYRTGGSSRSFLFIDPSKKIIQMIAHKSSHTPLNKQFK